MNHPISADQEMQMALECFQSVARDQKDEIQQLRKENALLRNELLTQKAICESLLSKWERALIQ